METSVNKHGCLRYYLAPINKYLYPSVTLVTEDLGMQVTNEDTTDW